jgi:hypothetical protein
MPHHDVATLTPTAPAESRDYTALDVANFYLAYTEYNDDRINKEKLDLLLWLTQMRFMLVNGRALFDDDFVLVSGSPLMEGIPFVGLKGSDIMLSGTTDFTWNRIDNATTRFLVKVYVSYERWGDNALFEVVRRLTGNPLATPVTAEEMLELATSLHVDNHVAAASTGWGL